MRETKNDVLEFWFEELAPQQWFQASDATDEAIKERFSAIHEMAVDGACDEWACIYRSSTVRS